MPNVDVPKPLCDDAFSYSNNVPRNTHTFGLLTGCCWRCFVTFHSARLISMTPLPIQYSHTQPIDIDIAIQSYIQGTVELQSVSRLCVCLTIDCMSNIVRVCTLYIVLYDFLVFMNGNSANQLRQSSLVRRLG